MNAETVYKVFLILIFLSGLFNAQVGLSSSDDDTYANTKIGSRVAVHNSGGDFAVVAVDEDSFNQLIDSIYANDTTAMNEMVQAGKLFTVDNDTPVRVLDKAVFKNLQSVFKVRVLKGKNADKVGWLPVRAVR